MERRRQPKNKKRAPAMVMELGEAARFLHVTQHGYENMKSWLPKPAAKRP